MTVCCFVSHRVHVCVAAGFGGGGCSHKSAEEMVRPHTEHGHVLLAAQVPVAPVGPVAVQGGVLLVVVGGLCAEGVNNSDVAPGTT